MHERKNGIKHSCIRGHKKFYSSKHNSIIQKNKDATNSRIFFNQIQLPEIFSAQIIRAFVAKNNIDLYQTK